MRARCSWNVLLLVGTADGAGRAWYPRHHKQKPPDNLQPQIQDLRLKGCTDQCWVELAADASEAIQGEMPSSTKCFQDMFQERLLNAGNIACSPGNIECSRAAELDGFLLVANNEMLDSWEHPPWLGPNWVVVRFNHCAVRWPQGEVRREFIVHRARTARGGRSFTTAERTLRAAPTSSTTPSARTTYSPSVRPVATTARRSNPATCNRCMPGRRANP